MVAELGHPVPGVQTGTAEPGLIGGVEQTQIRQFVVGGAVYVLRLLVQDLRGHLVASQFVEQRQHLFQKAHLLRGLPIHGHLGGRFQQRPLEGQQLAAVIQRHVRDAAGDAQHPLAQPPKTQHLGMTAGGIAAGAAHVHLRLMGGVLRHQQDLLAALSKLRHPPQHGIRFSRFGTADQDRQHSDLPQFVFFHSITTPPPKTDPIAFFSPPCYNGFAMNSDIQE